MKINENDNEKEEKSKYHGSVMKKHLRIKKGEKLHEWLDRIADYWNFGDELREMLHEISKESYFRGSNDAFNAKKK